LKRIKLGYVIPPAVVPNTPELIDGETNMLRFHHNPQRLFPLLSQDLMQVVTVVCDVQVAVKAQLRKELERIIREDFLKDPSFTDIVWSIKDEES
jgi:hypothetical protein